MTPPTDTERLAFLERNLLSLISAQATNSVYMDGTRFFGQILNEARGSGAGPRTLPMRARNLRDAIDNAINWKPT